MGGRAKEAIEGFRTLYNFGAAPDLVMLDLLEHAHAASVGKTLGPDALHLPSDQAARLTALGAAASAGTLSRVWSMLLKAHEEVRRAPDPSAAVEMALIRLCYAADLPGPEEALKRIAVGRTQRGSIAASGSSLRAAAPCAPRRGWRRNILRPPARASPPRRPRSRRRPAILRRRGEANRNQARSALESRRGPLRAAGGFQARPDHLRARRRRPANLHKRLSDRLKEWTGQPWRMVIEGGGGVETQYEKDKREDADFRAEASAHPLVLSMLEAFPGAEVISVRRVQPPPLPAETTRRARN